MAFDGLLVTEIFHSLQGETSHSGLPYAFVRLTGCNLRCSYCDSQYAFHGGTRMEIDDVLARIKPMGVSHVLLTGGEPLLQRQTPELVDRLRAAGYSVSIETHGEVSLEPVAGRARIVMDIKTPGSGMSRGGWENNLRYLGPSDEVKFVITSQDDYFWARAVVESGRLGDREILFSAAQPVATPLAPYAGVELKWLAERILEDRLKVRLQVQLHKLIWGAEKTGV
ncbi:MAG TPA: radical SAM protein [Bdellovibrionota bacterium]|nr:radical SAM protein [Bdellovibrionota bacterium]